METVHSDLILHVIDVSDPRMYEKISTVEEILRELGIGTKKQIYVFNKIDLIKKISKKILSEKYCAYYPQFVSAKLGKGCNQLISVIEKSF